MEIKKLIEDLDSEILGEKEKLFKNYIENQLKNFVFQESNLSPSLINLLMMKAEVKIPMPERREKLVPVEETIEIALLNPSVTSIYTDLMVGNNVYLYGRAGTGKTYLAKQIAREILKQETFVINCNQFTSPIDIKGGQTIEGYKQGNLSMAWEFGGVLILDELPKLDPNTAGILNEALAESAAEPVTKMISVDDYEMYKVTLEAAKEEGRELGFDISTGEEDGSVRYFRTDYPTMTDGKGDKLRKHPNFCCIATGNTNMKEISTNYSGNNRQDYSLVDRFSGSFYLIDYDPDTERKLTYDLVYQVSSILRGVLDADKNLIESVSLRTMLNFNRIYEQEGLRAIKSKYAVAPIYIGKRMMAKTFKDSLNSFVKTLPTETQNVIRNTDAERLAAEKIDLDKFIAEFENKYKKSPEPGSAEW